MFVLDDDKWVFWQHRADNDEPCYGKVLRFLQFGEYYDLAGVAHEFPLITPESTLNLHRLWKHKKRQFCPRWVNFKLPLVGQFYIAGDNTTPNQLLILGFLANVLYIDPNGLFHQSQYLPWLQARLGPFLGVNPNHMDYTHLESLSCLKFESFITRDLAQILNQKMGSGFDYEGFKSTQLGEKVLAVWEAGSLKSCQLTSVGQILGVMVSDQYVGGKTSMSGWGG